MVKIAFAAVSLWLSLFTIKAGAESGPVPYRVAEKKLIPVNMIADICLLPGEKTLLAAVDLARTSIIKYNALTGQKLEDIRPTKRGRPLHLISNGKYVTLIEYYRKRKHINEAWIYAIKDFQHLRTLGLSQKHYYQIASASGTSDGRYVWVAMYMHSPSKKIVSLLYRLDLQMLKRTVVRRSMIAFTTNTISNTVKSIPSNCWLLCADPAGKMLVSSLQTNMLQTFSGNSSKPVREISLPFIPRVLPRASGRFLPIAITGLVAIIDLSSGKTIQQVKISGTPRSACVNSDGTRVFISIVGSNEVLQIDMPTGILLPDIDFAREDGIRQAVDAKHGYDVYDIVALRWADNPPRLIGLGYYGYILILVELKKA